jgi:hypothetical protein
MTGSVITGSDTSMVAESNRFACCGARRWGRTTQTSGPLVGPFPGPWLLDRRIRTWLTGLLDVEPYAVVRLFTSPRRAPSSGSDHCSPGGVLRRCVGPDWKIVNECAVRPQEASAAADAPAARATTRGSGQPIKRRVGSRAPVPIAAVVWHFGPRMGMPAP